MIKVKYKSISNLYTLYILLYYIILDFTTTIAVIVTYFKTPGGKI